MAVVASLGGSPTHPVWYSNVVANPHVELQDGPPRRDYTAREVTGAEKALWWESEPWRPTPTTPPRSSGTERGTWPRPASGCPAT